jgi:hypothetical protein
MKRAGEWAEVAVKNTHVLMTLGIAAAVLVSADSAGFAGSVFC